MPLELRRTVLPVAGGEAHAAQEDDDTWTTLLPMMITLVLYSAILMSASYLLRAISEEKKNRLMEVLLLSVSPGQMLAGKTVACGIAGLLQLALLYLIGYLLFFGTGWLGRMPAWVHFSPAVLLWSALLCLLGYGVYATLHAGAGALMADWRSSRGISVILAMPALIGFYITLFSGDDPHGLLITVGSLFPLTAPFAMISRLIRDSVPLWQLLVSCAGMALTAYAIMRAVTAMFHAQNLLSGEPLTVRRYIRALLSRPPR
jgi:ABC-2 type transport system permease protein